MSSLRRRLLASPQNETFYTKFTVKFLEGDANNILYDNSTKYYGIAFTTKLGAAPISISTNHTAFDFREEVIITENQSGAIIASYSQFHVKNENVTNGTSHKIYNTDTDTKLKTGLYTVEVWFKAKGKLTLTEDSGTAGAKDIVYIQDYKSKSGTDKNATEYTTTCLYSVEIEKPKGEETSIGFGASLKKGIINKMTYFIEGE